jgi:hypothetical protein
MPNEAGIGEFIPQRVGTQSVTFQDVLVNVNFADYHGYRSIINTTDAGGTYGTLNSQLVAKKLLSDQFREQLQSLGSTLGAHTRSLMASCCQPNN